MLASAVILIGIQATGKSSLYQMYYKDTHIRINLDMLKTRNRENQLLDCCLKIKQPFVIDNTNLRVEDRQKYITKIQKYEVPILGYYFSSKLDQALIRNLERGNQTIPEMGILSAYTRLELPSYSEGFDYLYYIQLENGKFKIQDYLEG